MKKMLKLNYSNYLRDKDFDLENRYCNLFESKDFDNLNELLRNVKLIIVDEAPMCTGILWNFLHKSWKTLP
jgi:hypothetical protein